MKYINNTKTMLYNSKLRRSLVGKNFQFAGILFLIFFILEDMFFETLMVQKVNCIAAIVMWMVNL